MKGFERRLIKKSLSLPLLHLTSIFSSVCLTFACVLCCAALVLLLCVALTYMLCKHGCKYMFFQSLSYYIENMASRSPKTWCLTHFHVLIKLPKSAHLIIIRTHPISSSKISKNVKKQEKSVISVITQKSVIS